MSKSEPHPTDIFKASIFLLIVFFFVSIGVQTVFWILYEKIAYSNWLLSLTPLILCIVYVQLRGISERRRIASTKMLFGWTLLLPFIACAITAGSIFVTHSDLIIFTMEGAYEPTALDNIALYSGRICLTSLYLMAFCGLLKLALKAGNGLKRLRSEKSSSKDSADKS